MPYGISFFDEVFQASQAGEGLPAECVAELAGRLARVTAGATFEDAFDMGSGWRAYVQAALRDAAYAAGSAEEWVSARVWHSELLRYYATHYDADLIASVKPTGPRGRLYAAIIAARGRVPSLRSIQRALRNARQPADVFGAEVEANRSSEKNDRS